MSRLTYTDLTTFKGRKIWESETSDGIKSVGAFKLKDVRNDFYLYPVEKWELSLWNDRCNKNERLFRYETATSKIGGFKPLIKVNMVSGLVYFMTDLYSETVTFESISEKPIWIDLNSIENYLGNI